MLVERYFRALRLQQRQSSPGSAARDLFVCSSSRPQLRCQGWAPVDSFLVPGAASIGGWPAHKGARALVALVALTALLSGCTPKRVAPRQPRPVQSQVIHPAALVEVNRLLVAPIEVESGVAIGDAVIGDLSEKVTEAFKLYFGKEVLFLAPNRKLGAVKGTSLNTATIAEITGQEGVDAVVRTRLLRFVERSGSVAGSDRPAEIGFRTSVLRSVDGKEVWTATYSFRDRALSESIFANRPEGRVEGGWQRADSIARDAFVAVADAFAKDRLEQFESSGGER